ncbi:hypothetical protein BLA29_008986 [Euroglyphus maynei]|uniref:Uncharacterized protein n=1 Tax=Euroglyphus maynei TaxID=6958 RepID=A0A1Y3BKK9_EURMA|nr:hypothetical protein BLA29_008986 [Euroglyphus maynei]
MRKIFQINGHIDNVQQQQKSSSSLMDNSLGILSIFRYYSKFMLIFYYYSSVHMHIMKHI